jgi:hypothetical protein
LGSLENPLMWMVQHSFNLTPLYYFIYSLCVNTLGDLAPLLQT